MVQFFTRMVHHYLHLTGSVDLQMNSFYGTVFQKYKIREDTENILTLI